MDNNDDNDNKQKAPWGFMANRETERVRQSLHDNGVMFFRKLSTRKPYGEYCSICGYYIAPREKLAQWTSYKYAGIWLLCEYCDAIAGQEILTLTKKLKAMLVERGEIE